MRIAVHEDATRFGWLDKTNTKQHKLPTVLNSAARTFNSLPLSSALGFPFAAPNNKAKKAQAGEAARVALWKSKTSEVQNKAALQRLEAAKKARRGGANTGPPVPGRMGVTDVMGVEPRPRPWALPKTAKKGKKTGGGSGGRPNKRMLRVPTVATDATAVVDGSDSDSDSDDQKDAESFKSKSKAESEGRASTEVVVKNAAVGAVSPVAVMPGAGKSTRPLRRPGAVVPRNLGSRASKSASRPSVDRRSATASAVETPAQTTAGSASNTDQTLAGTKDAPSAAQGKAVEGNPSGKAADNEPSIMSDMVVSNTFTAGGVGRTDRSLNGGSSRNNPVSAAADSSTSAYSAGHKPTPSAAAQKETTGAQRSRGRSGEIVPTGSPAHKEAAGSGTAKGPKKSHKSGGGKTGRLKAAAAVARFRKNPRKAKRRSSATLPARDVGETQPLPLPEPAGGPVLAPELEPEPSPGEAQARLAADLTSSLLEEALLEICGTRQE